MYRTGFFSSSRFPITGQAGIRSATQMPHPRRASGPQVPCRRLRQALTGRITSSHGGMPQRDSHHSSALQDSNSPHPIERPSRQSTPTGFLPYRWRHAEYAEYAGSKEAPDYGRPDRKQDTSSSAQISARRATRTTCRTNSATHTSDSSTPANAPQTCGIHTNRSAQGKLDASPPPLPRFKRYQYKKKGDQPDGQSPFFTRYQPLGFF